MSSTGEAGKRDGMDRAERHADEHWKQCITECLKETARTKQFYDCDDVTILLMKRHPNATTHEQRAVGPMMSRAKKLGYGRITDMHRQSMLPWRHRRPIALWYSDIYEGGGKKAFPKKRKPVPRDKRQLKMDV